MLTPTIQHMIEASSDNFGCVHRNFLIFLSLQFLRTLFFPYVTLLFSKHQVSDFYAEKFSTKTVR